jgi:hypothetical protein
VDDRFENGKHQALRATSTKHFAAYPRLSNDAHARDGYSQ